ncbi:MAG: ABC transporter ATP-binding protein, partial [Oscillospiraceae bacterium]|nr:ABC transporter ATP-binding protein [Oscillospiraceae bacterium]
NLVDVGPAWQRFANPLHPYTQALLSAIPIPDPRKERARVLQTFDTARFEREGELTEISTGHFVLRKGGAL